FDTEVVVNGPDVPPTVTWGTSPQDVAPVTGLVPDPAAEADPQRRAAMERALNYMGLSANDPISGIPVDKVFIGSCTNARIEDMRAAAAVASGGKVADGVYAMVVPGSGLVKAQAEEEGLHTILMEAGFDWREPGCSMCLAMNPDKLLPGERCASTSNRNFEGRQGTGGRTHLMSPAMAALAAIQGTLADIRDATVAELPTPPTAGAFTAGLTFTPAAAATKEQSATAGASEGMAKFTKLRSIAAPLDIMNVDTDMIIPKQFLKTIKRTGLGVSAFYELRYTPDGNENPDFVLNQEPYRTSKILVAGDNFGCGSSREHAPWAIQDFGIQCVISTSFADIFYNNCFKNGMLPIKLPKDEVAALMDDARKGLEIEINLEENKIVREGGEEISFEVNEFRKHCLINGLDDIGLTMQQDDLISQFEARRAELMPWL
ncbi:hypothetical protein CYMTET_42915, partial [Cymbomonas tetramitiformis]